MPQCPRFYSQGNSTSSENRPYEDAWTHALCIPVRSLHANQSRERERPVGQTPRSSRTNHPAARCAIVQHESEPRTQATGQTPRAGAWGSVKRRTIAHAHSVPPHNRLPLRRTAAVEVDLRADKQHQAHDEQGPFRDRRDWLLIQPDKEANTSPLKFPLGESRCKLGICFRNTKSSN